MLWVVWVSGLDEPLDVDRRDRPVVVDAGADVGEAEGDSD
jgi:hypothetical protein